LKNDSPARRFWQVKQESFEKKDTVPRVLAQRVKKNYAGRNPPNRSEIQTT
jgi:hypothetical protein